MRSRTRTRLGMLATCLLGIAWLAGGCAPQQPLTVWGYSDWYRKGAPGMMGTFESQRKACLEQAGIADPGSVEPNSPVEWRFVQCMNAAQWCTSAYNCEKPAD